MGTSKYDFGMIGLGTMGRNFVYNICDKGYRVAGYDRDKSKLEALNKDSKGEDSIGLNTIEEFVEVLKTPRVILLLVPAGKAVDAVIAELKPLLNAEDLIVDCGNSHYIDTDTRIERLQKENLQFMGVGISGGEEGARYGPSIMPGGAKKSYERVEPMLRKVAAQVKGDPCVVWLGPGSAGHYVKMVHNGIEYAIMQLIAESYSVMKHTLGMNNEALHNTFAEWNTGRLQSYLIEITADIFQQKDEDENVWLIDKILDASLQNGTGKWTSQSALDLFVPIPSIDAAVTSRNLSALKAQRMAAHEQLLWQSIPYEKEGRDLIKSLEEALYFSIALSYAQGFCLMKIASDQFKYNLKLDEVAEIWRGGCIIRSTYLDDISEAYSNQPELVNLMADKTLSASLIESQKGIRTVIKTAVDSGIAVPVMMASLSYFDAYRTDLLPANLIQAQRDYFGAHTYSRINKEGIFHTQWKQSNPYGSKH